MTQVGTDIVDRIRAREILLGDRFAPRRKDIDTPKMLLEAGFPPESLRLVGFPADKSMEIKAASQKDENGTLFTALCICGALRWRADDEPVLTMTDVQALIGQDVGLLNTLARVVLPFLGLNKEATDDAKNGSEVQKVGAAGPQNGGGSESQTTGDSTPSENASSESNGATS